MGVPVVANRAVPDPVEAPNEFLAIQPIIQAEGIRIGIPGRNELTLVQDVSFALYPGRTLALVGESGSGKSLTALSLLRLLPEPSVGLLGGSIWFDGHDLMKLDRKGLREVRGGKIAMIFQEPLSALNPVMPVGKQIREAVIAHEKLGRAAADRRVIELLELVRMPDPEKRAREFPHRLSGGMRQRVLIAIAMAGRPRVLIADEPTTALDVTVQAEILEMLRGLQEKFDLALLLITHDLGLVADYADDVAVMYAGKIVEHGPAGQVLEKPLHPYTKGLQGAQPHRPTGNGPRRRLTEIPGAVPRPSQQPPGCAFAPRCPIALPACAEAQPAFVTPRLGQSARCIRAGETA